MKIKSFGWKSWLVSASEKQLLEAAQDVLYEMAHRQHRRADDLLSDPALDRLPGLFGKAMRARAGAEGFDQLFPPVSIREKCPKCGEKICVNKAGRLVRHGPKQSPCLGSGAQIDVIDSPR